MKIVYDLKTQVITADATPKEVIGLVTEALESPVRDMVSDMLSLVFDSLRTLVLRKTPVRVENSVSSNGDYMFSLVQQQNKAE